MTENLRREHQLRQLARVASPPSNKGEHVGEPLLALMRDGDQAEDLHDAIAHVAQCVDCRARLTEGEVARRSVVVMAIEAPRASARDLEKAAGDNQALLVERGEGRWTAVVDAAHAASLKEELEKPDSWVVSRLAMGTPFEVPLEELRAARGKLHSIPPGPPQDTGTAAAEVQAWVQVGRKPKQKTQGLSPGWILFGLLAILGAVALAYVLATR
jgi:hypothetical protein